MIETPPEALKQINDIIQNFIWEGKTAKITQNTLIMNIDGGGLNLYHYPTKVDALKLSWITKICSNRDANWKTLPKLFYNCDNLNLYFSANDKLLNNKNNIPPFYKDIHNLFMKTLRISRILYKIYWKLYILESLEKSRNLICK